MQFRRIRLRFRRRFKKSKKQVEEIGSQAEQQLEEHFFGRFEHLLPVRRFIIGWIGLLVLLIGCVVAQNLTLSTYFQTLRTIPGGIYTEGVLGRFSNANPIYATSEADTTVSRLVFASLFTAGDQGTLDGELASSYSVNSKGTVYTVHLKPHLKWQDGQPLTSADVAFTYQTIQDPDALSPLLSSWRGITVTAPDPQIVVFTLPDPLASFPYSLTNGIVPKHILASVPAADLRSADFNTIHMVGSGPFELQGIQVKSNGNPGDDEEQIALVPFARFEGGSPKLDKFVVDVYSSQTQLTQAFSSGQLTAMEAVNPPSRSVQTKAGVIANSFILRAANMVFFKTSSGVLADKQVRQALVSGANVPAIINKLGYETSQVREPLLADQFAYNPIYAQAPYDLSAASKQLTADGWTPGPDGIRVKAGQPLGFTLTVADTAENHLVAGMLQKQWQALGVQMTLQYLDAVDFQSALTYHDYTAVLNGISIGIDPDVFVYWASSQASITAANDLNFSEYKNPIADASLEGGRTRLNPLLRTIKYQPFLQAWQQDAPALGLYQPRLLYLTNGLVSGLQPGPLTSSADRFNNVQNWEIRQAKVSD
jgi:peptide/nickel transport system substrate-binding protein